MYASALDVRTSLAKNMITSSVSYMEDAPLEAECTCDSTAVSRLCAIAIRIQGCRKLLGEYLCTSLRGCNFVHSEALVAVEYTRGSSCTGTYGVCPTNPLSTRPLSEN